MFKALKGMAPYSKKYNKQMLAGFVMTLCFSALALVDPYVFGFLIDGIIASKPTKVLVLSMFFLVGATLLRALLRYFYFIMFEEISQKITNRLRQDLYKKLQSMDFGYFDKTPTGQIMSRMTGDIDAIRHFYAWITHMSVFHGAIFIFALVAMVIINPLLTGCLILVIPGIAFFSVKLTKEVKPTFLRIRDSFSKLNSVVQENISGNRVVRAYAQEHYEWEKFEKENQNYLNENLNSAKVWEKYLPILDGFAVLFNVALLLFGGIFILKGKMTIGELVSFNQFLWMINNPLRMLGWLLNDCQRFATSFQKVNEMLQENPEITNTLESTSMNRENLDGHIVFDHVSFAYENMFDSVTASTKDSGNKKGAIKTDQLVVLKDIDFEVAPGQTVAIIGSTGSGKSTLTNLLSRFYDVTEGEIRLDGVPIRNYDLQTLRSNISMAMQDIFLFSDTIEGNISYGVPDATMEEVEWASEIAGVNEFIHDFEEGYNTIIGERGVGLSGGQKQRIALARALIQNPTIMILDDTTSAVDMETEYRILTELKKTNANRTTFIIAHRISSVKDADLILVMDQGTIIERGNHKELLEQNGYYHTVFFQQMGEFDRIVKEAH